MNKYPELPWTIKEAHKLWEQSQQLGHTQIALKCRHCSQEFIILTFRKISDILNTMRLKTGKTGDAAL